MIEAQVLGNDQDPSLGQYLKEWLAHSAGRVRPTTYSCGVWGAAAKLSSCQRMRDPGLRSQEGGWKMGTFVLGRRPRLRAVVVVLSAVVVGGTWLVVGSANPAQATVTTLATFNIPGTYMWTVPTGVTKITFS